MLFSWFVVFCCGSNLHVSLLTLPPPNQAKHCELSIFEI